MSLNEKNFIAINNIIHHTVESIFKKINKKIYFRLYSIELSENQKAIKMYRVKKTISLNSTDHHQYIHDSIPQVEQVFHELNVDEKMATHLHEPGLLMEELRKIVQVEKSNVQENGNETIDSPVESSTRDKHAKGTEITYSAKVKMITDKKQHEVVYLLSLRNLEETAITLFNEKQEISFIQFVLDYIFTDFFDSPVLKLNAEMKLNRKYQEDATQFLRRMGRLFFGKVQSLLSNNSKHLNWGSERINELRNEYYINNLLEKIDDISTKTYEGSNPFGSILFLNKSVIIMKNGPIEFAIRFKEEDKISLDDAKRIRKLIELTNADKHLYLIADQEEIYGLGEVNWHEMNNVLAFRVDFKGLSKYNLMLVDIDEEMPKGGLLITEGDHNIYRSERKLIIVNQLLVSIGFKNPKLGEESYSPNKMMAVLQNEFWPTDSIISPVDKLVKLERVIRKAREQHHGTMVVITDPATAEDELLKLGKQSTLIEPTEVNPDHIKYLTSIDGAIYFDTKGECRAIGVILDGIAQERLWDASRGARFKSAHRYSKKLLDDGKKCVIVIISEDGMVNIIPESDDEEQAQRLIEEIIDLLEEEPLEFDTLFLEKENNLSSLKITDFHLLYQLARRLHLKKRYEDSIKYYEWAFREAQDDFIPDTYHNMKGVCHFSLGTKDHFQKAAKHFEIAIELSEEKEYIYLGNAGNTYVKLSELEQKNEDRKVLLLKSIDAYKKSTNIGMGAAETNAQYHNKRGLSYNNLASLFSSEDEKLNLINEKYDAYSSAIDMFKHNVYYLNRAYTCIEMGKFKEAAFDLIHSFLLKSNPDVLKKLKKLMKEHPQIVAEAVDYYQEHRLNKKEKELEELFENVVTKSTSISLEAASAKEID